MEERKKILVIDDDEIELDIVETMLKNDYEIIQAQSGEEAITYLCTKGSGLNLVLLDIVMPHMNGWEVFNRIKAISFLQNIPIVFLTSLTEAVDEKRGREMGAADYIMKPYNQKDLLERIQKIIG